MTQAAPPDELTAEGTAALAQAWLSCDPLAAAASRALEVCRQAGGDARLHALSRAFEALHISLSLPRTAERLRFVQDTLAEARSMGWWRAIALSEAAEANICTLHGLPLDRSLQTLVRHGPVHEDRRPAAERVWTDKALSVLHATQGRYAEALEHALRAEALATRSGLPLPEIEACQSLAYVLLCVGDVDTAEGVLQRAIGVQQRNGRPTYLVGYNLLLCKVVAGRQAEAAGLLNAHPDLLAGHPGFAAMDCLVARVWQDCGEDDRAARALAGLGTAPDEAQPALRANRAWLEASVRLRQGQPSVARKMIEDHLAEIDAGGIVVSPMNRTQLEGVLSQACEALGDLPAALEALKRSRLSCFTWVADSMRSRLTALHWDPPAQDAQRHQQRLRMVDEAVQRARDDQQQQASARQARFLAQVTHEMRNPLNGLIGMTSLLALSRLDDSQRKYLGLAQSSARILLALCNDVLDLARVESGRFELNPQLQPVAGLLEEAVQVFLPQLQVRGLELQLEVAPEVPAELRVDRLRLQQVVMNLVGNAAKFTRQGKVSVKARWEPLAAGLGELCVDVQDTGPGLTAAQCARLFQEFRQADATVAQEHGGSGLGLALCRALVELMGGSIGVESEPGRGSRFGFRVPLARA